MTAEEFWDHVKGVRLDTARASASARSGSASCTQSAPIWPTLVRGTDVDPFYDDRRLPEANEFIRVNWPYETPALF